MTNQWAHYIESYGIKVKPLMALTGLKKSQDFELTAAAKEAYDWLHQELQRELFLHRPDYSQRLHVTTDASDDGYGGYYSD